MISLNLEGLRAGKNLLGFSAGVDSSCLFFLLLEHEVNFDIAFFNFHLREASIEEEEHALSLATKFKKKIFIQRNFLKGSNLEQKARDLRFKFFKEIMLIHQYKNLLLAHNLNDKFEWFLMQMCRGAGIIEMLGFNNDFEGINISRPLINVSRGEIMNYLNTRNIKYFIDESNVDLRFKRNFFRMHYATPLIDEFARGIRSSLNILEDEGRALRLYVFGDHKFHYFLNNQGIFFNKQDDFKNIFLINLVLKNFGYVMSAKQRKEILKANYSLEIGNFIIDISSISNMIFVAKLTTATANNITNKTTSMQSLNRWHRDRARRFGIPSKIRTLLDIDELERLIKAMKEVK